MTKYEYKVVPAPRKAPKIKGVKGTEARFAASLAELMNQYGADGWEYQRTDTLPCEERTGFTGRTTVFQNILVFRREIPSAKTAPAEAELREIEAVHGHTPRTPVVAAPVAAAPAVTAPETPPEAPEASPAAAPADSAPAETAQPAEPTETGDVPSFRASAAAHAEPPFSSRATEGRTPKLGAARHPEPNDKAPGVAAQ